MSTSETKASVERQLAQKRAEIDYRLSTLKHELVKTEHEVVGRVKENALWVIAGTVGVGVLAGWLLLRSRQKKTPDSGEQDLARRIADQLAQRIENGASLPAQPVVVREHVEQPSPKKASLMGAMVGYALRMLVTEGVKRGVAYYSDQSRPS